MAVERSEVISEQASSSRDQYPTNLAELHYQSHDPPPPSKSLDHEDSLFSFAREEVSASPNKSPVNTGTSGGHWSRPGEVIIHCGFAKRIINVKREKPILGQNVFPVLWLMVWQSNSGLALLGPLPSNLRELFPPSQGARCGKHIKQDYTYGARVYLLPLWDIFNLLVALETWISQRVAVASPVIIEQASSSEALIWKMNTLGLSSRPCGNSHMALDTMK